MIPLFTESLLNWATENPRPLPWKNTKNPYIIWLSEVILQQTRVEQGKPYFEKFAASYPTVTDLANAPEDEVMRLWEGLGYYSRARNMHFAAKYIANDLNGVFPNTYVEILKLKGVGTYTAAAIASFAYDLPHAVLDGNVYRVFSRYFGIGDPIDTTGGKKIFERFAKEFLHKKKPAIYNQAIMDFGATQCVPKNPNCEVCPMIENCVAYLEGKIGELPFKSKKIKRTTRFFNYLLIKEAPDNVYLTKRMEKDIWQNLYEFPMIATQELLTVQMLLEHDFFKRYLGNGDQKIVLRKSKPYKQQLTHQKINACFFEIELGEGAVLEENKANENWIKVKFSAESLDKYGFPRIINTYLEDRVSKKKEQILLDL